MTTVVITAMSILGSIEYVQSRLGCEQSRPHVCKETHDATHVFVIGVAAQSRSKVFGEFIHLLAISKKATGRSKCVVSRPNTGTNKNDAYWSDIKRKYVRYPDEDMRRAERDWNEEYARGGAKTAKVKRKYTVGVLTGSVTPFWGTLEILVSDFPELGYSQADSQLQVWAHATAPQPCSCDTSKL